MPEDRDPPLQKILEGFSFTANTYCFTEDDHANMAAALGIEELNSGQKLFLQTEQDRFAYLAAAFSEASRPAAIRKILKTVHADTKRLMITIHALHPKERGEEGQAAKESARTLIHQQAPGNDWADFETDFMNLTQMLSEFGVAVKKVLDELPNDAAGGGTVDYPFRVTVNILAEFFHETTGSNPSVTFSPYADPNQQYSGRFFRFVETFLSSVSAYRRKSNAALGTALKRTLDQRRKGT